MEQFARNLLLHSLDNELAPADRQRLDEALHTSEALQQEQTELLQMREWVAALRPEKDASFAARVMSQLPTRKESGFWADIVSLSPRVAAACAIVILAFLLSIYSQESKIDSDIIIGVEDITTDDAFTIESERKNRRNQKNVLPFDAPKQQ